ncbi:MAG: hypothetical protein V4726_19520 [Verrucomicrobiota bacterium]
MLLRLILIPLGATLAGQSQAASVFWDGATNTIWGTAANWATTAAGGTNPAAAPGAADTAVFSITSLNATGNDRLINVQTNESATGLVFDSASQTQIATANTLQTLSIGSGGMSIASGAGNVILGFANTAFDLDLNLTAGQSWTNNSTVSGQSLLIQDGADYTGGGTATLTIAGAGNTTFAPSSALDDSSGTLALAKSDTGTLTINSANTYSGGTSIPNGAGTVIATNSTALGTGTVAMGKSTNSTGGTLELRNNINIANNFTFNTVNAPNASGSAQIRSTSGNNTLSGNLTINTVSSGNGLLLESASGSFLTFSGNYTTTVGSRLLMLTGDGDGLFSGNIVQSGAIGTGLRKYGTGTWTATGTSNATTNLTTIFDGKLVMKGGSTPRSACHPPSSAPIPFWKLPATPPFPPAY